MYSGVVIVVLYFCVTFQILTSTLVCIAEAEDGFSSGPPQNEAIYRVERPRERYSDLGGMEATLQDIREVVELMFTHIELFSHLGTDPPHGVLMHGPPGCGESIYQHFSVSFSVKFCSHVTPNI